MLSCVLRHNHTDCSPPESCPWDFPGRNTGVGCHFLLQGIFQSQGWNLSFLHWQVGSLPRTTKAYSNLLKLYSVKMHIYFLSILTLHHFPCGTVVKNLPANARNAGSIPRSGRSPGRKNGNPLEYFFFLRLNKKFIKGIFSHLFLLVGG